MFRKLSLMSLLFGLGLFLTQCSHVTEPEVGFVRDLTPLEKSLVKSSGDFGLQFFREVVKQEGDKNIFVSPLSVSMALGMTLNGANGETKAAMEQTLTLAGMSTDEINQSYQSLIDLLTRLDPKVKFQIANSIWYRQEMTFEQDFIDLNKNFFDAIVRAVDFGNPEAAAATINAWVSENTNGRIEEIVKPESIDWGTVMFLVNAIYFKGTWTFQFDKDKTRPEFFTLLDSSRKQVPMMHLSGDLKYFQNDHFQAVDLPYGDGKYNMMILLPNPAADLDALAAQMDRVNWQSWIGSFSEQPVDLAMPKFRLEYELTLNDVLKALGMEIAFDTGRADFTRMYKPGGLFIDEVKHKTFVEVDEEGTEAAAATSVEIGRTSLPDNVQMRIDRPFLLVIHENHSETILFIGKIIDPS